MIQTVYVDVTGDGEILRLRVPPSKGLGPEMRAAGVSGLVWMGDRREWWLPSNQWIKAVDVLSANYTLKMTELAQAAITQLTIDDSDANPDDLYVCATQLGLRIFAPEHVVHATWISYLAQPEERAYLKGTAEAYLRICRVRGFQPEFSALQNFGD